MRYDIYRNDFQIDGDILTENLYFLCYTYIGDGMKRYIKTKKELKLYRVMRNWVIALSVLCAAWFICSVLKQINTSDVYVPMIFVLAVLIISLLTDGYFYGVLASVVSVIGVNWAFTYPYWKLDFSIYGYPLTFMTMLAVGFMTAWAYMVAFLVNQLGKWAELGVFRSGQFFACLLAAGLVYLIFRPNRYRHE